MDSPVDRKALKEVLMLVGSAPVARGTREEELMDTLNRGTHGGIIALFAAYVQEDGSVHVPAYDVATTVLAAIDWVDENLEKTESANGL